MFSEAIKTLGQRSHMPPKALASVLCISPGAISQYEKGKSLPSREILGRMVKYFSVSVDYLMGSSANEEIEQLMKEEYCGGIKTSEFLKLCMEVDASQRSALLTAVTA